MGFVSFSAMRRLGYSVLVIFPWSGRQNRGCFFGRSLRAVTCFLMFCMAGVYNMCVSFVIVH